MRFKRPGLFTRGRLGTVAIYTGVAYAYLHLLWRWFDFEIEFLDEEEIEEPLYKSSHEIMIKI